MVVQIAIMNQFSEFPGVTSGLTLTFHSAGVPQVVLPLWFDLYNYAATAEYRGIGVWPGRETAPVWDADSLGRGFIQALVGASSESLRKNAKELANLARQYGGRNMAAQEIVSIAAKGHA